MPKLTYNDLQVAAEAYHAVAYGHPLPQIGTLIYQIAGVHFLDEVPRRFYAKLMAEFGKNPQSNRKKPRALWSSERGNSFQVDYEYSTNSCSATGAAGSEEM